MSESLQQVLAEASQRGTLGIVAAQFRIAEGKLRAYAAGDLTAVAPEDLRRLEKTLRENEDDRVRFDE